MSYGLPIMLSPVSEERKPRIERNLVIQKRPSVPSCSIDSLSHVMTEDRASHIVTGIVVLPTYLSMVTQLVALQDGHFVSAISLHVP